MSRADEAAGGAPQQLNARDSFVLPMDIESVAAAVEAVESDLPVPAPGDGVSVVQPASDVGVSQKPLTLDPPSEAEMGDALLRPASCASVVSTGG